MALSYVPLNPDTLLLKRLKKQSQFDYLINIKADIIRDDLGVTSSKYDYLNKNITKTTFEIYDLNTLEIIYSRMVRASVSINENESRDLIFTKEVNGMRVSSLRRILKKLNK